MEKNIKEFLNRHSVEFILHEHPAVFTCKEAEEHCKHIHGIAGKNLFLKEKESERFFLVILPANKRLDVKKLEKELQTKKLRFGTEKELEHRLNLKPGSVSPLGLMNDKKERIEVIIEKEMWDAEIVSFHPNINTASLEMTRENFHKLMNAFKNKQMILEI